MRVQLTVSLPVLLVSDLDQMASINGVSRSRLVEMLLRRAGVGGPAAGPSSGGDTPNPQVQIDL